MDKIGILTSDLADPEDFRLRAGSGTLNDELRNAQSISSF